MNNKKKEFFYKYGRSLFIIMVFILSFLVTIPSDFMETMNEYGFSIKAFLELLQIGLGSAFLLTFVLLYPFVIIMYHLIETIILLFRKHMIKKGYLYDCWSLLVAFVYEFIFLKEFSDIQFVNWQEQLYNTQLHSPIHLDYMVPLLIAFIVFILALIVLMYTNVNKIPPLLLVINIAVVYLGTIYFTIWTFQVMFLFLTILPMILLWLIVFKVILMKVREFKPRDLNMISMTSKPWLYPLVTLFNKGINLPWIAVFFILPILGIILIALVLFGQGPSDLINAFTQTSDWMLSMKEAPPNIAMDEHYLCTVAASGHKEIVKPLRSGVRHGHRVTVNRQLQIANAFEQILEEKTPRLHKFIRGNYDKYGYPIARLIHSKWMADIIWFIMKPAEWMFLMVIYLCDVHPEDRIAIQYTGKNLKDFNK